MPNGTLLALGELARAMLVVPEHRMVVVAFGSADGFMPCPNGTKTMWTQQQSLRLSQLWKIIQPMLLANDTASVVRGSTVTDHAGASSSSRAAAAHADRTAASSDGESDGSSIVGGGACYCYCSDEQAIGKCAAAASKTACTAQAKSAGFLSDIRSFCPNITHIYDCFDPATPCDTANCSVSRALCGMALDPASTEARACPPTVVPGKGRPLEYIRECNYYQLQYSKCVFVANASCAHSPLFP